MLKKIFTILFSSLFCLNIVACSCNGLNTNSSETGNDTDTIITLDKAAYNERLVLEDSSLTFVENGVSEYSIVVEDDSSPMLLAAIKDMIGLIQEATGAKLPLVFESEATYTTNSKYIVFGCDSLRMTAGIVDVTTELGDSGYHIASKDNSVFVQGNTMFAFRNAAYAFLQYQINLRVYSDTAIYYDENATQKLKKFALTEVPDFEYRVNSNGMSASLRRRLRYDAFSEMRLYAGDGDYYHTSLKFLPTATYQASHPDWYNTASNQLCYTARGNEQEYTLLVEEMAKQILAAAIAQPYANSVLISQTDNALKCSCDSCEAMAKEYGTITAAVVKFVNAVSVRMESLFAEKGIDREMRYYFFAYQDSMDPPVKWNEETGEYEPFDETVRCRDDVGVLYAPMYATFTDSFLEETNAGYAEQVTQWSKITKNVDLWLYGCYFREYMLPFNDFYARTETMDFFKELGATTWFQQGEGGQNNTSAFNAVKDYVDSQKLWNTSLDYNGLVQEFFDMSYGSASDTMMQLFNNVTTYLETWETYAGDMKDVWGNIENRNIWKYGILTGWKTLIEQAYKEIESEKGTKYYDNYYKSITLESLFIDYALITYCSTYFSETELLALKQTFKKNATLLDVSRYSEKGLLGSLYQEWGIA